MKTGDKVKFTGASIEQTRWGSNDDPYKFLIEGDEVTVRDVEVHSWHTKLYFVEIPGKYNAVCFEPVAILTLPEEHVLTKESISSMKLKPVPEEKKNTMENMTKEQAAIKWLLDTLRPFENMEALGPLECFKIREIESLIKEPTASGSVAAPKEEPNIDDNPATYTHFDMLAMVARQTKHMFEENTALREALKELLPIAERLQSMYKDPDSLLASYDQQDKAIIERARKLILK